MAGEAIQHLQAPSLRQKLTTDAGRSGKTGRAERYSVTGRNLPVLPVLYIQPAPPPLGDDAVDGSTGESAGLSSPDSASGWGSWSARTRGADTDPGRSRLPCRSKRHP